MGRSIKHLAFPAQESRKLRGISEILYVKRETGREKAYKDLLNLASRVRGCALVAIAVLYEDVSEDPAECVRVQALVKKLEEAVGILSQVIGQREHRVL